MNLDEYRTAVSEHLLLNFGLSWADACGEVAPLQQAIQDGETPLEFAERFARKFDLDRLPINVSRYRTNAR